MRFEAMAHPFFVFFSPIRRALRAAKTWVQTVHTLFRTLTKTCPGRFIFQSAEAGLFFPMHSHAIALYEGVAGKITSFPHSPASRLILPPQRRITSKPPYINLFRSYGPSCDPWLTMGVFRHTIFRSIPPHSVQDDGEFARNGTASSLMPAAFRDLFTPGFDRVWPALQG